MITKLKDPTNGSAICRSFSGGVGASAQRTVPSHVGAAVAVPCHEIQKSGLGGTGTTCATIRTKFGHAPGHDQSSDTDRTRMQARWTERDEVAGVRCSLI